MKLLSPDAAKRLAPRLIVWYELFGTYRAEPLQVFSVDHLGMRFNGVYLASLWTAYGRESMGSQTGWRLWSECPTTAEMRRAKWST